MNEQLLLARRYARMAWPYRWAALAISTVGCLAGWGFSLYTPNTYQVSAKIFVDTRSMLRPLLRGLAVENDALSNTANLMKRTLLTRPSLEEVARKTDLDLKAKNDKEFDKVVIRLAAGITLTGTNQDNIYQIAYVDTDKTLAKRVVDELLNSFLETALGSTRKDTAATQKFLDSQIDEYEKRLLEAEQRLKEFKQRNVGQMPDAGSSYFQALRAAKDSLKDANRRLQEAQNRSNALHAETESAERAIGSREPSSFDGVTSLSPLEERMNRIQQQLDNLRLQYTERHPDIVGLSGQLEILRKQRDEEIKASASHPTQGGNSDRLADSNSMLGQMRLAVAKADAEVSALTARVQFIRNEVTALEKEVDTIPEIEAELKRLDRDYGLNRQQFDELVKRRESARLSEEVDQQGSDVKLKVIEPPRLPLAAIGPDRVLYMTATLVVALVCGAALAFLLSQLNPRFYSTDELKEITQLPVLGAVSLVYSERQRTERKMELAVFAVVLFALMLMYGGLITLELLQFDLNGSVRTLIGGSQS